MGTANFFNTDRRIKLGIWGLGRGMNFLHACRQLNIDIVAGCDYNEHMRENFRKNCPDAFITADENEFLAHDFDAVLVATWLGSHTEHSIRALNAGKHVMCEVTSFMTPADGVRLVEAVEASGKCYNLLENYPFTKANMYLKRLWDQGFFGEFMYAEYDYVHEIRSLSYTYIDGVPIQPGYEAHQWRSWLNLHYYCTHSLGPVMYITGLRPTKVTALPNSVHLAGYLGENPKATAAPSLIQMSNGGVFRNLMGATPNDSHTRKIWGTLAAADMTHHEGEIRIGASGHGRLLKVDPQWENASELAEKAGHGGGDFWEVYYFVRQILTGEPAPWNIYSSCDVTLAGIMAIKSTHAGGEPQEIPDFRDPAVRDRYRNDHFKEQHFDPKQIFPAGHDPAITGKFSTVMSRFSDFGGIVGTILVRSAFDGMVLYPVLLDDANRFAVIHDVTRLINELPEIAENYREAKKIADAYPGSLAANTIESVFASSYADKVFNTEKTIAELKEWLLNK